MRGPLQILYRKEESEDWKASILMPFLVSAIPEIPAFGGQQERFPACEYGPFGESAYKGKSPFQFP